MGSVQKVLLRLRCLKWGIIECQINFLNEINKLLDNFVILNPFRTIFSDYIPDIMTYCNMLQRRFSMFTDTNISTSMLIGCGPKKSNFQILLTESSSK